MNGPTFNATPDGRTWANMNKEVIHFNGLVTNLMNHWTSRASESTTLERANYMFQDDMAKPLKYLHVWNILKNNKK